VIIKHQPLASPEEAFLDYLTVEAQLITAGAEICFIGSENKMKRILSEW